jgi:CRP-like cAMP-binding protein
MTIENDIAFLEQVPVLRRLGRVALRIVAIGAENLAIEPGQVLFTAGEIADGAYVVQRGSLVLKSGRASESDIVAGPGTLLGESALLAETKRAATATAGEGTSVLRISRTMFLKMLESNPEAAKRLRETIAARADQLERDIESVHAALTRGHEPR